MEHLTFMLAASKSLQSCPTLCDPIDGSPPGSPVPGILQARTLEWVAISFSRGSSWPRDWTQVSRIGGRCFNLWATREFDNWILVFLAQFSNSWSAHYVNLKKLYKIWIGSRGAEHMDRGQKGKKTGVRGRITFLLFIRFSTRDFFQLYWDIIYTQ